VSNPAVSRVLYIFLFCLNLVIGAFLIQLGAGKVPIPDTWQWATPLLLAGLNGLAMFLPRAGGEFIAQQVDALKARGVARRDMVVVTQEEAVVGIANAPPPDAGRHPDGL
jgi:hypothetical protein